LDRLVPQYGPTAEAEIQVASADVRRVVKESDLGAAAGSKVVAGDPGVAQSVIGSVGRYAGKGKEADALVVEGDIGGGDDVGGRVDVNSPGKAAGGGIHSGEVVGDGGGVGKAGRYSKCSDKCEMLQETDVLNEFHNDPLGPLENNPSEAVRNRRMSRHQTMKLPSPGLPAACDGSRPITRV
jgi:hypothetical protein